MRSDAGNAANGDLLAAQSVKKKGRQYLSIAIAAILAVSIFVFDYLMPLGVASSVAYVTLVLVGLAARSFLAVLLLAGLATLLTVIGLLLSPDPIAPFKIVIINRALALFVIWSTAAVSFFHLRLLFLANRDPLTKVYNQDYFRIKVWEQIKAWHRYRTPFTLILVDIAHLRKLSKEYGAIAGKRILKHVARLLQIHTRTVDTVCRYSGDEFAILLPMVDLAGALAAARRIQQTISGSRVRWGTRFLEPKLKISVVELLDERWDLEALIAEARKALKQTSTLDHDQDIRIPESMRRAQVERNRVPPSSIEL